MLRLCLFLTSKFLKLSLLSSSPSVRVLGYSLSYSHCVWLSCEQFLKKAIRNMGGGEGKLDLRWGLDITFTKTKSHLSRE